MVALKRFALPLTIVLILTLLGCSQQASQPETAPVESNSASQTETEAQVQEAQASENMSPYNQEDPLNIVFVTHDLGAGIFAPVRTGMEDACLMVNATCEFLGPQKYDPTEQVALIEAAIAKNPDAIVTTRPEPGTYDDVVKKALEAGIMVIGFNTNDPAADAGLPIPFVGQDFTNYGVEWAKAAMADLPDGGKITIADCCFGHYALEERNRSFIETLENEGGGKYEVVDVIDIGTDETAIYGIIEAYYQANPDIDAIYGVDYYSHVIAQFVKNNNLQGKLKTGGSDMGPGNIEGLEQGYVSFGLGQNPYLQGFYPVMMTHLAKRFDIRPVSIDTGTDIVTPENFADYNPEYR
ncbi:MAG TPA: substrate-binding domain-containing protein [Anaerolineae bacterium]|nr:substrate-binding domain-containing protein [Anaerolineae bacterium]HMR67318.1 substrate-binding domain-containing protein [Anaerolineae bacterium]